MNKKNVMKSIVWFIVFMLLCTILSRRVYEYLLPVVQLSELTPGKIENKTILVGEIGRNKRIINQQQRVLLAEEEGEVKKIEVDENTKVKKGDPLIIISNLESQKVKQDTYLLELRLNEQKKSLQRERDVLEKKLALCVSEYEKENQKREQVEENYEVSQLDKEVQELERMKSISEKLYEKGGISRKEYEDISIELQMKKKQRDKFIRDLQVMHENRLGALQLESSILNKQLQDISGKIDITDEQISLEIKERGEQILYAPIDGYIADLQVYNEAQVKKEEELMTIMPMNIPIHLVFSISMLQAEEIKVGQSIDWILDNKKRESIVIDKDINREQNTYQVTCELSADIIDEFSLDRESYREVMVEICEKSQEYQIVISNEALMYEGNNTYIFVAKKESKFWGETYITKKISVDILEQGDFYTAIDASIPKAYQVIVNTSKPLVEDLEVKLR